MNRWKFALLSARGQAKINGQVYKIDEKIYNKQKIAIITLSVIFIVVFIGLFIIKLAIDYDTGAYCIAAFCMYSFAYYLLSVFLIPKDIENYITLQENDTTLEIDSIEG